MPRRIVRFTCLLPTLMVAACAASLDVDQARICRILIPALNDEGAALSILTQRSDDNTVSIVYGAATREQTRQRHLACTFQGGPQSADHLALSTVATEAGPLTESELFMLQRFWLETPEATFADPSPVAGADSVPHVPRAVAMALQQTSNALPLAAIYSLLAAAYSLVYGLVGRINLAFGEFAAIGGYAALFGVTLAAGHAPIALAGLALVFAVSCATFHGIAVGRLVFMPLMRASGQRMLVATVGLSLFLQEYLRLTQGSGLHWVAPIFNLPFAIARAGDYVVVLTPIAMLVSGITLAAAFGLVTLMARTRFGRDWRAFADDPGTAALFGVHPGRLFAGTFALACAMAGLSGFAITIVFGGVGFGYSTTLGLKALIAAILGGIGSIRGAFLGGLAVGLFEAFWSSSFPVAYRDIAVYALLALVLLFRPGGFLGDGALTPRRV